MEAEPNEHTKTSAEPPLPYEKVGHGLHISGAAHAPTSHGEELPLWTTGALSDPMPKKAYAWNDGTRTASTSTDSSFDSAHPAKLRQDAGNVPQGHLIR